MYIGLGVLAFLLWVLAFGFLQGGSGGFYLVLALGLLSMIIAIFTRVRIPTRRNPSERM